MIGDLAEDGLVDLLLLTLQDREDELALEPR
jgi:hypothetical protein